MVAAARRTRLAGGSTCDRLSALPDDLLHPVLSLLPSREVVQMSVLSKSSSKWEKMEDFTPNLLMLHNAPTLDTFRFRIDWVDHDRVQTFNRLIRHAIMYRPLLCRLKRLHLSCLSLDTSFTEHLRDKCPVLEDLDLHDCEHNFREIQSSTLMNLRITGVLLVELVIRAPALATLILRIYECITLRNRVALLGSLFNVMLDEEFDKFSIFKNLRILSLKHCLGNVSDVDRKFKALGRFLQKAPNLEKLTLEDCWYFTYAIYLFALFLTRVEPVPSKHLFNMVPD
ncbi:hypothetical protein BRADI_5g10885v3 [Brachypodium distachyon]|uniref:F-box domain-containing protein n=1 Tax=Brachypodium distachyon TaxID=15368 RepID=A0A2K2CGJ1_BRADI|nr:hypothetical protein BRADI_5g10885v3 [Brachypodium distachyon]